ncbi:MAG TPA: hypothetical protein VN934_05940 [Candidatus Tumulicola sp.]|nr:hypothetical protein [Candidatus Tumulicola sp.]
MRRRKAKTGDMAQARRFIDKAKELGCDESGESFEQAFKKIVPPKRSKKP